MMRVLFACLPSLALASSLTWVSLPQGKTLMKSSSKILMVEISSPTCHYCQEMEQSTLCDPAIIKTMTTHFIPVKLMVGKDAIPEEFKARMTPTFFFLDAHGKKIIPPVPGAWVTKDFQEILNHVVTTAKGQP